MYPKIYTVLQPEFRVESIDDLLYRIGMSFESVKDSPKRNCFNNSIMISIGYFVYLILRFVSLGTDDPSVLAIIGDPFFNLGVKNVGNQGNILLVSFNLYMQAIYALNYKRKVKTIFVNVFQAISGSIPFRRIGIQDSKHVERLITIAKTIHIVDLTCKLVVPPSLIIIASINYLIGFGFQSFLAFYIPILLFDTYIAFHTVRQLLVQLLLFFLLFEYFILRLKGLKFFSFLSHLVLIINY